MYKKSSQEQAYKVTMVEPLQTGQNFCSLVSRKKITFKRRQRSAILKSSRNSKELTLLKNEISFYREILPLYNVLNKLKFSGRKFCPTFFRVTEDHGLLIEDLRKYRTKEHISFQDANYILDELAKFHATGFYLKRKVKLGKSSQRIRGRTDYCTLVHGDCWTRNFMFCGEQVKLIDFGFFSYDHCLVDVTYFLLTSTQSYKVIPLCLYYKNRLKDYIQKLGVELDFTHFRGELARTAERIYPLARYIIGAVKSGPERKLQLDYSEYTLRQLKWRCQRE